MNQERSEEFNECAIYTVRRLVHVNYIINIASLRRNFMPDGDGAAPHSF